MKLLFYVTIWLYMALSSVHGAKVLVTVMSLSGSQNLIMYRFADLIGSRGHDVTVLKAEIFPEAKVPKLKYAKEMKYIVMQDEEILEQARSNVSAVPWDSTKSNPLPIRNMVNIFTHVIEGCETLLTNEKMMKEIKDADYDVIVVHIMDFCAAGVAQVYSIPMIWFSTAFLMEPMAYYAGVPFPSSYIPASPHAVSEHMTFLERSKNLLFSSAIVAGFDMILLPQYTGIFRKHYGPDFPAFPKILAKTQLTFVNSDPIFDFPRPTLHNIIYVGGLTMQKKENLTADWSKIVSSAGPKGIVVFSMGTVVQTKSMPLEWKMAFLNAFKKFPQYTFIWRLEGEFPEAKSASNVIITTWLPQKDLLGRPEVKAFITHGGYNSLTEAVYHGVPVLVLPLFGDQYANVQRVFRHGVGQLLEKTNINEDSIASGLKLLLHDQKLQARADRLSKMVQHLPVSAADLAVNWVEYLAEFKDLSTLQPYSTSLGFIAYHNLDSLTMFGAILSFVLFILFTCIRAVFRRIFGWHNTVESKTKKE